MFSLKKVWFLPVVFVLFSCSSLKSEDMLSCACEPANIKASCYCPNLWFKSEKKIEPSKRATYGNDQDVIVLQNLTSRDVATCYRTLDVSAEDCAALFETKGFVRLSEIPHKTANYDFLKTDTYPTRRWRGGELTPRW